MLPLIVERLQAEHPYCALHVRSMQDEGSGASVVITVDDLANRSAEVFTGEIEALRGEVSTLQHRLHAEERLKLAFEAKYQAVTEFFRPMLVVRGRQMVPPCYVLSALNACRQGSRGGYELSASHH
jgi:hypothetical protein